MRRRRYIDLDRAAAHVSIRKSNGREKKVCMYGLSDSLRSRRCRRERPVIKEVLEFLSLSLILGFRRQLRRRQAIEVRAQITFLCLFLSLSLSLSFSLLVDLVYFFYLPFRPPEDFSVGEAFYEVPLGHEEV